MAPMPRLATRGTGAHIAWALVAVDLALATATIAIVAANHGSVSDLVGGGALVPAVGFPILGALVVRRHGSHAVGWLLIVMGLSLTVEGCADNWATVALEDRPGSLPFGTFASWLQAWAWMPGWLLATTLLPAVFPEGRPRGRVRLLAWVAGATVAAVTIAIAAVSWHLRGPLLLTETEDDPRAATLDAIASAGVGATGVLACVSFGTLAARLRRGTPTMRRQGAWVAYGVGVAVAISLVGAFVDFSAIGHADRFLRPLALMSGIGLAMLRHDLYDIDVVVNRTLVYGSLTALLAATYGAGVLLLQLVLSPSSDLAVAGSTLAVAALVGPARARIQSLVDRRFYRHRYDARQTLAAFSARLRDEVSLDALGAELRAAVTETMHPAHVSIWIRPR
jgi:hypothetical protein